MQFHGDFGQFFGITWMIDRMIDRFEFSGGRHYDQSLQLRIEFICHQLDLYMWAESSVHIG